MRKEHRNISFNVHRLDEKRWEWVVYLNTGEDVGFAGTEGDEEKATATATATARAEIDAYLGKLESPRADEPAIMPARRFPPPWTVEEQDACLSWSIIAARSSRTFISRRSPAGDQAPSCSRRTRRGGLRSTWRSCRSCCSAFKAVAVAMRRGGSRRI
jgi:hypothetical protein